MEKESWVDEAWEQVLNKVGRTSKRIGAAFPHASQGGVYVLERPHWWTAGFWPGLLWLLYRDSGEESFRQLAEACEEKLDQVIEDFFTLDHDIGFMWTLTSLTRYRLLGGERSRKRALLAATLLLGRFNAAGQYIRAWNPWTEGEDNTGWAIIDCCMNLPLLFWAAEETGDPRFKVAAQLHADTVVRHFIRDDGSVRHIVRFDSESGEVAEFLGGQGYSAESAWSRGTAWALYGLALCYNYTGKKEYLFASQQVAHFFVAHLPEDSVPHWDFRLPAGVSAVRDSSAGAIGACGLVLLGRLVPASEADVYRGAGEKILRSLYENYGVWEAVARNDEEGLLLHGTSHFPSGSNVDVPLIYGDYYFVEGLAMLKGASGLF
ncbi:unsaturated chondroitin disaccharide hydrolase [Evansella caseinilytica]|uniref:Unsaturated chondroitin disaccharide hydrolase n=1 Tax=Evansella caseinilytica TaxID=1503961 RepID=A0A1H3U1P0_9BACI|nr:glycoside hydrolase family 88 protein [Evansella caseinilytica]SDZ55991.1 unsaturated chondroitin disaccharide hydrolase [Evansella caseinilytica]